MDEDRGERSLDCAKGLWLDSPRHTLSDLIVRHALMLNLQLQA